MKNDYSLIELHHKSEMRRTQLVRHICMHITCPWRKFSPLTSVASWVRNFFVLKKFRHRFFCVFCDVLLTALSAPQGLEIACQRVISGLLVRGLSKGLTIPKNLRQPGTSGGPYKKKKKKKHFCRLQKSVGRHGRGRQQPPLPEQLSGL
jgi:hypothetical protein